MTVRMRYVPGQGVADRWPGWTTYDMSVDEAREVARHCPNRIEVEAVDDIDDYGTPTLTLGWTTPDGHPPTPERKGT